MARDESLLFHHLKMTGEAIAWVQRTVDWAEPNARATHMLDAVKLMTQATRTLAKGKRRPWSDPQEHLEAAYALGCQAWVTLFYTLKNMPPQYRWYPYDVPCINGCRPDSDVLWVGDYFCFDCWANAWTNYAIQRAYWASD